MESFRMVSLVFWIYMYDFQLLTFMLPWSKVCSSVILLPIIPEKSVYQFFGRILKVLVVRKNSLSLKDNQKSLKLRRVWKLFDTIRNLISILPLCALGTHTHTSIHRSIVIFLFALQVMKVKSFPLLANWNSMWMNWKWLIHTHKKWVKKNARWRRSSRKINILFTAFESFINIFCHI